MRSTTPARSPLLCVVAVMALLAGCGSDDTPAAPTATSTNDTSETTGSSTSTSTSTVELSISVGTKDGPAIASATLSVAADGSARGTGFLDTDAAASAAAAAVRVADAHDRLVNGEATDQICTEIYGGPDLATVTGTIGGDAVSTVFHRSNGCGIADWDLLQALLGRPRWSGDERVFQRDEQTVSVKVDERFSIELPSNATTGYAWTAAVADEQVMTQTDHTYIEPTPTAAVGTGGWDRFSFEAVAPGTTTVSLEYKRSFEPGVAPVEVATFAVHISGDDSTGATTTSTTTTGTADATSTTLAAGNAGSAWPALPDNAAGTALATFATEVHRLYEQAQPLIVDASRVPAGATAPAALTERATVAVDAFFSLVSSISDGLHPEVRNAAVDVVFALGREIAPFLFAPGWEFDGWDVWASGVEDAIVQVPVTVARLAEAAKLHPQTDAEDVAGPDGAAFHSGLDVLLVRGFGHANFNTQPPWSVQWIGGLPDGPGPPTCFVDGRPVATGSFVDGVGGCAVLYYDTSDPSIHDAELEAWLADPLSLPSFRGEVITVRRESGEWRGVGSAE